MFNYFKADASKLPEEATNESARIRLEDARTMRHTQLRPTIVWITDVDNIDFIYLQDK